ncbi:MAG: transposase [Bacteroidales bacterium]|nr:MAG: transposase [Bacteroidales bacterium]
MVNPADVPTKSSEKLRKTDTVDSGKLARSLRANELKGIYTPDSVSLEMRSLIRLKNSITKDTTRQKNRLKSQLRYLGIEIPQEFLTPFFQLVEALFFAWLKEIETLTPSGRQALDIHIRHLEELRRQKLEMTRALRTLAKTDRFPRTAAVDYERSGVRAGYGNGVPLRDMRHNPLPQCRTTGCLYRNDPDVP